MPEPAKRVAVVGLKKVEAEFGRYVRKRLEAERSAPRLVDDMRQLEREAEQLLKEARGGS